MLETSNLAHKYTHMFRFRKYTFQYQGPFLAEIISLLKAIVTDPSFMSVLELWQFLFIRDSPKIGKSEKNPSEFCPIAGV